MASALAVFRDGLRASELVDLRWDQVHFTSANLDVSFRSVRGRTSNA